MRRLTWKYLRVPSRRRGTLDVLGMRAKPNTAAPALALMASGAVTTDGIHTHTFPLDQFAEALATFVERRDGAMKVVLEP